MSSKSPVLKVACPQSRVLNVAVLNVACLQCPIGPEPKPTLHLCHHSRVNVSIAQWVGQRDVEDYQRAFLRSPDGVTCINYVIPMLATRWCLLHLVRFPDLPKSVGEPDYLASPHCRGFPNWHYHIDNLKKVQ